MSHESMPQGYRGIFCDKNTRVIVPNTNIAVRSKLSSALWAPAPNPCEPVNIEKENLMTDNTALIAALEKQERELILDRFDELDAYALGESIRSAALQRNAPVTIEIRTATRCLYFAALPGSAPDNQKWGYLKAETVFQRHQSSMLAGLQLEAEGRSQYPDAILPPDEYVLHGGAFPIRVKGVGLIAAVGISGLPSIEDHELSATAIAKRIGIDPITLPR